MQHQLGHVHAAGNLVEQLVRRAEQVGVVLAEAADAGHAGQLARLLVAVDLAEFGDADGELAVAVGFGGVDADVVRAVHRPQEVAVTLGEQLADDLLIVVAHSRPWLQLLFAQFLTDVRIGPADLINEAFFVAAEAVCLAARGRRFPQVVEFTGDVRLEDRRVLAVLVVRKMAARAVEVELGDLRRVDRLIAALEQLFENEGLEDASDDGAARLPQHEAGADQRIEEEQAEFLAELAVVAFAGLLHLVEIGFERLLVGEGGAVDALELLLGRVAMPVRARDLHDLEGADAAGAGDVRTAAEVLEVAGAGLAGDVEAQRVAVGALGVVDLVGVALSAELLHGCGARHVAAPERAVLLRDLLHLGFDRQEVVRRQAVVEFDVVVEAVLNRRPVGEFRAWPEGANGLGHDVRTAMACDLKALGVVERQGGQLHLRPGQARAEVDDLAVDLGRHRLASEAGGDRLQDLGHGSASGMFDDRAVGQADLHHRKRYLMRAELWQVGAGRGGRAAVRGNVATE